MMFVTLDFRKVVSGSQEGEDGLDEREMRKILAEDKIPAKILHPPIHVRTLPLCLSYKLAFQFSSKLRSLPLFAEQPRDRTGESI